MRKFPLARSRPDAARLTRDERRFPWPIAIAGGPTIDLDAGGYTPVVVEIEVPMDAEPGASVIVHVSAADTTAVPARRHLIGLTLQLASPRERLRTSPQESVP